jgi:glucose dehydrogenase
VKAYLLIIVVIMPSLGLAEAQNALMGANWELPGFDAFNTNFNPQTQITNQNVADLQTKWVYQVPAKPKGVGGIAPEGIQTTPMAINGIVYFARFYRKGSLVVPAQHNLVFWKVLVVWKVRNKILNITQRNPVHAGK